MSSRIPDFDHNLVIPPHLGNARDRALVSPYSCSTLELCEKLGCNSNRRELLTNLLAFRKELQAYIQHGFQWIGGSFTEHIEISDPNKPRDIDLVSFYYMHGENLAESINAEFPAFFDAGLAKKNYRIDHYAVDLNPENYWNELLPIDQKRNATGIVNATRYWINLFSHTRERVWKGLIKIPIYSPEEDDQALKFLQKR